MTGRFYGRLNDLFWEDTIQFYPRTMEKINWQNSDGLTEYLRTQKDERLPFVKDAVVSRPSDSKKVPPLSLLVLALFLPVCLSSP